MKPYSPELLGIVIVGFIIGFLLAFGIGANDVANSFGSSVGSKVYTLRQACILASVCEILGSVLLGYKVSSTIRTGIFDVEIYSQNIQEIMYGYLAALVGSSIWNIFATYLSLPVSGTHSIVGAVAGFSLVSRGIYSIKWHVLGQIVASWFLSPVLSGFLSSAVFLVIKKFILTKEDATAKGFMSLPFFYGITIVINLFAVIYEGPRYIHFDVIPWWAALAFSVCVGTFIGIGVWYIFVPKLRQKICTMSNEENNENIVSEIRAASENPLEEVIHGNAVDSVVSHDLHIPQSATSSVDLTDTPESALLFTSLQQLTAILTSFSHGANDVSNAVGPVIAIWLIYKEGNVMQKEESPVWMMLYGGVGMCFGLWVWGQKVMKIIGKDLTKIIPSSGFTIEIGASLTVLIASKIGLPISTTHCIVGSVVFVGWTRSRTAVDWKLFGNIVLAWILTVPVSAILSGIATVVFREMNSS